MLQRTLAALMTTGLMAVLVQASAVAAENQPPECQVSGPAQRYSLTLADFGQETAHISRENPDYWGGTGYLVGFRRHEWDTSLSSPRGGLLLAGIILARDEGAATGVLTDVVAGWMGEGFRQVPAPKLGDEIVVAERLTTWEALKDTPMGEVFFAMRRCNAVAHVVLNVMSEFGPVDQAMRYAWILDERLSR